MTLFEPLPSSFYEPSAARVAPALLGHYLVRRTDEGISAGMIVETEGYLADDPSCHGYRGETARNRSMYGHPGMAYVYFIYGNYFCFNAVCCPKGTAEAVLIRAIEPVIGLEWMQAQRPVANPHQLSSGPAKLCLALDIGRLLDGVDLCSAQSPLFIARNPRLTADRRRLGPRVQTTRIGLSVAADWPLRFYLDGSAYVSKKLSKKIVNKQRER